jgi:hypothetical protein
MNSKFGNLTRRQLGIHLPEADKLKKFSDTRKVNSKRHRHCQKPTFEFICVYQKITLPISIRIRIIPGDSRESCLVSINTSYTRAGLSCLPLIGPVVALCNALEVRTELSSAVSPLSMVSFALTTLQETIDAVTRHTDRVTAERQTVTTQKPDIINTYLQINRKGRLYAGCGIIGTVATAVGLIALGIFSIVPGDIVAVLFTVQAVVLSCSLYRHHKTVVRLESIIHE